MRANSSAPNSERYITAAQTNLNLGTADTPVIWEISGKNSDGCEPRNAVINLSKKDTIKLAVDLLRELAPDLLVKSSKFSETPVGTYLRNTGTGEVVKVTEWDERFSKWTPSDDTVAALRANGDLIVPFQDSNPTQYQWEVVEAYPVTVFKVVG